MNKIYRHNSESESECDSDELEDDERDFEKNYGK